MNRSPLSRAVFLLCSAFAFVGVLESGQLRTETCGCNGGRSHPQAVKKSGSLWSPLVFMDDPITRVVVDFDADLLLDFKSDVRFTEDMRFETRDKRTLELVEFFLDFQNVRTPAYVPEMGGGWGGSGIPYAKIIVEKKSQTFEISLSRVGFGVAGGTVQMNDRFESWGLAKFVDDLLIKETGRGLPTKLFSSLSGEGYQAGVKESYDYLATRRAAEGTQVEEHDWATRSEARNVGLIRDAAAVFHYRKGRWGTGGRTLFNMNPEDAVTRLAGQFEPIGIAGQAKQRV